MGAWPLRGRGQERKPGGRVDALNRDHLLTCVSVCAKKGIKAIFWENQHASRVPSLGKPRRIKALHRWQRKCTTGHTFYANNNPIVNTDPDGRDNCPGQSRGHCIRSDSGAARDLRSTPQQDSAAIENRAKVETSQKPEKALALIGTANVTAQPVNGKIIRTTAKDGINLKNLPPGTKAVEHSHIDGKIHGVSSDGFISPGDAQPLGHGIINYAVSERRVAKYEIVSGRIQVTAIKGSFTSREANKLEQSVNAQQQAIDSVRPIE